MDITTGAIGSLLPKLDELHERAEEYKLLNRERPSIEYISTEMKSFQAALRNLAEVPRDQLDQLVKMWAADAKELSYRIDDFLDSLLMDRDGSKPANLDGFQKVAKIFKKRKQRSVFADGINEIKVRVRQTADRRDRYMFGGFDRFPAFYTVDPRLLVLYKDPREIIGIEESSKDLFRKIYQDTRQLKILPIFGSMGLGKTTLAKAVYDKIGQDFDCRAFVIVGPQSNLNTTFRNLLLEICQERDKDFSSLNERQLIEALRIQLQIYRYLIVVDDIWDIQTWETIRCALVDNDYGSSVIITTRILEVAQRAGEVYKLKPLSHANSRELFYTRIFGGKDEIPCQLAEVAESIIKKCGCIPLATITMASLLVSFSLEKWSAVCNSVGFGDGDDREVENTRKICLLSYYKLPSQLRTCLLHLSVFPEGYMIRKDTLIWMWIAQGLVHDERGQGLFEVGERYFKELINKSLVQPVEIPHSGIIIGCRVNVMVFDMIHLLSREENFVTVLDSHKQDTSDLHQARLLAIQNSVVEEGFVQENEMLANKHVRSFNATKCEFQMMPSLASFKCLRVLALEDCASIGGIYHLEHIRELVQLRYLGLLNTPIYELPEGIGNLKFVQILDLRETKIDDLPHGIVLLTQLKCLRVGSRSITVPDRIGNLASLEELQLNDVSSSPKIVKELGKLTELRDLKLWIRLSNERSERELVESLGNLQKIEILHLHGGLWIEESCWEGYVPSRHLRHVFLGMKFSQMPAWINPELLPNLSHLSVDVRVVKEEDLLNLGSFPELLYLSLAGEYVCLPDIMSSDAFPSLKYCYTSVMVRFFKGAAPRLEFVSFNVRLCDSKDGSFDLEFSSLLDHPLLQEVRVEIFYTEAHVTEVDKVEAALNNIVDLHLNSLILDISKWESPVSEQYGTHDDIDDNEYYYGDNDHEYYYDEE